MTLESEVQPVSDKAIAPITDNELIAMADGARGMACLLYTSDAADERSSVDLGGRRIIKKNKKTKVVCIADN